MQKNTILNLIFEIIIGILGVSLMAIGIVVTSNVEIMINVTWPLFLAGGVFILLSILTLLHGIKYRRNKEKKEKAGSEEDSSEQQKDNSNEV